MAPTTISVVLAACLQHVTCCPNDKHPTSEYHPIRRRIAEPWSYSTSWECGFSRNGNSQDERIWEQRLAEVLRRESWWTRLPQRSHRNRVEGSASKDNEKRDIYFTKLGLWVGHLSNEVVQEEEILRVLDGHKRSDEYS
jgi:hypothetical protein